MVRVAGARWRLEFIEKSRTIPREQRRVSLKTIGNRNYEESKDRCASAMIAFEQETLNDLVEWMKLHGVFFGQPVRVARSEIIAPKILNMSAVQLLILMEILS